MDGVNNVLGIGAGPANLSLAALAEPCAEVAVTLLEARQVPSWHPGLLWDSSRLQVSPVKDLVSLVDPTNPHSFLNFLREEGRLYRHLVAAAPYVSRKEFSQYFCWAAKRLPVHLGRAVRDVDHDGRSFVAHTDDGAHWRARHLVLGVGQRPWIPPCARDTHSDNVWHAADHLHRDRPMGDRNVLLVGGGQSAAEIAADILSGRTGLPRQFTWAGGGRGFAPVDNSPFTNDWFNPRYVEFFQGLPEQQRHDLLGRQSAAAHGGISAPLLEQLYRRLYEIDYLLPEHVDHRLLAGARLIALERTGDVASAVLEDATTRTSQEVHADYVILATGYRSQLPEFMAPLAGRLNLADGAYRVGKDYRIAWDGPASHHIHVQNAAGATHGVADPNLSLAAWRSALILNSICGREVYALKQDDITIAVDR
ncbi:SidA/IucD/PvdA family monooxygenase [Streptomyces sp. CT34]|uniref:lysine N(6)-hydroxylase/L-ornithine N(5)-oxygenase family protein n=1 Tax=Streptomyces sp. CT34 TaxID=1553907 RepID=UPI00068B0D4D|nr:SidA/IucD/PvdA family monooxygenase [Streptomyces sp. CT34]